MRLSNAIHPQRSRTISALLPQPSQSSTFAHPSSTSSSLSAIHLSTTASTTTTTIIIDDNILGVPFIVGVALVIGISAQALITKMIGGDRGLGAYLSDGRGFAKSGFSPTTAAGGGTDDTAVSGDDPLPWLGLPTLEFVEVAGQSQPVEIQMESLRQQMNMALEEGRLIQATKLRKDLEEIMMENGFDYIADDWQ